MKQLFNTVCYSFIFLLRFDNSKEKKRKKPPFSMGKCLWCDHLIRACNKLKWLTPFKWPSENIVANIDDQIVLFTFYALKSTVEVCVFCKHMNSLELYKMQQICWNDRRTETFQLELFVLQHQWDWICATIWFVDYSMSTL